MKRWLLLTKSKPETPAELLMKDNGEPPPPEKPSTSGKGGIRCHSGSEQKRNAYQQLSSRN